MKKELEVFRTVESRLKRNEEKKKKLIQLLIEDRYIFFSNIAILFCYKNPKFQSTVIRSFLSPMVISGDINIHIMRRKIANKLVKVELYYLTDLGLTRNLPDAADISKYRFSSANLPLDGLAHRLESQRAMIKLMNLGCRVQRISFNEECDYKTLKKYPDFLFEKDGVKFAVEYERTLKKEKMYHKNAGLHLTEIKLRKWNKVVYIFAKETARNCVRTYFERITEVQIEDEVATIKSETLFSRFIFLTVDELESWAKENHCKNN